MSTYAVGFKEIKDAATQAFELRDNIFPCTDAYSVDGRLGFINWYAKHIEES